MTLETVISQTKPSSEPMSKEVEILQFDGFREKFRPCEMTHLWLLRNPDPVKLVSLSIGRLHHCVKNMIVRV